MGRSPRGRAGSAVHAGYSYGDYLASVLVRSVVERQLGTIGEAFAALRRLDPVAAARISALPRVVGFRNALIHNCDKVDNDAVWTVIERELPALLVLLDQLLDEADGGPTAGA